MSDLTVTFHQEPVLIEGGPMIRVEPDPEWEFIDPAGHLHKAVRDGFPTLRFEESITHDADGDEWNVVECFCRVCDAEVEPAWRHIALPDEPAKYIPGMVWYEASDAEGRKWVLDKETALALHAAITLGWAEEAAYELLDKSPGAIVQSGPWRVRGPVVIQESS